MLFDRESTIVVTKFNNLSESVLTAYCQKFGSVIRCLIKTSTQSRNKDPYALVKFAEISSATSILSQRNHIINGIHVVMRTFQQDKSNNNNASLTQTLPSSMSLNQTNSLVSNNTTTDTTNTTTTNNNNNNNSNGQKPLDYDKMFQENQVLKYDIANLQKSLMEAQAYSKTAYDTFQVLREKFEAEQILNNKLKLEYTAMVESYEVRLKETPLPPSSSTSSSVQSSNKAINKDKVKEEPIDNHSQVNLSIEIQRIKDHLEQAQIDLGKCQTENTLLNAKLISREQQFDIRFKELNNQYVRMKKHYEHVSSCIKDFHTKLYPKKRLKTETKDENINKSGRVNENKSNDSNNDIVEIIMRVEPLMP
ncbi:unnamed protein product [Rotaria magnacalcarata]|uniref:RRM domain-containing protein n=1 Tax=Rotaria magnacalcarata TaxID=392030 RepID=A0A817AY77_9BILA|nr:unnamed protein product [Rotaria magnacalcarata]CAF3840399.1 unnamed protein product [Rotaria magnacalcarata]